jgi:predicted glycosyltransferase
MRNDRERFTLEELKELGFDFSAIDPIVLIHCSYFTVGYIPQNNLIRVCGIMPGHTYILFQFCDDIANYHIEHIRRSWEV